MHQRELRSKLNSIHSGADSTYAQSLIKSAGIPSGPIVIFHFKCFIATSILWGFQLY